MEAVALQKRSSRYDNLVLKFGTRKDKKQSLIVIITWLSVGRLSMRFSV